MKPTLTFLTFLLLAPLAALHADDSAKIAAILVTAADRQGVVTIPPGDYDLGGKMPLKLS